MTICLDRSQSFLIISFSDIFVVDVPEDERAVTVYHQISQAMESKNHERIVQLCTKEITEGIAKGVITHSKLHIFCTHDTCKT